MKIVFSGGGTLGPVTPLLGIYEVLKDNYPTAKFLWVGTKSGPEGELVRKQGIYFVGLTTGKFRRYRSFLNIVDFFLAFFGFFASLVFLIRHRPSVCVSAGGFVSVPLHLAAWCLRIPTWIHQQDARVGLSNKLMAPLARLITTALEKNVRQFSKKKTVWLGNPVRADILTGDIIRSRERFSLGADKPVILVTGGGTGAERINQLTAEAAPSLTQKFQIIHLVGQRRAAAAAEAAAAKYPNYHIYKFFTEEMKDAYAVADLVVSRGGFGALSELSALKKPAIIIPLSGQQEDNVKELGEAGAVVVMSESTLTSAALVEKITSLLSDPGQRSDLGRTLAYLLPVARPDDILRLFKKYFE